MRERAPKLSLYGHVRTSGALAVPLLHTTYNTVVVNVGPAISDTLMRLVNTP